MASRLDLVSRAGNRPEFLIAGGSATARELASPTAMWMACLSAGGARAAAAAVLAAGKTADCAHSITAPKARGSAG